MQMNTAKWPFSIDEDALHVIVDVALPRFLDSAAVHMHGICIACALTLPAQRHLALAMSI